MGSWATGLKSTPWQNLFSNVDKTYHTRAAEYMENHMLEEPHTLHGKCMIQKEKTYLWKKIWIVTTFIVLPSDPPLTG